MKTGKKRKLTLRGRHILFNSLGILLTVIGVIGIVTPVLPTTIFFILASGLFFRSNPGLYRRLHKNRVTGGYLRVYTEGAGMSRKQKTWSILTLWLTLAVSAWFVRDSWLLLALLGLVGAGVSWHIAAIKPRAISESRKEAHLRMMAG